MTHSSHNFLAVILLFVAVPSGSSNLTYHPSSSTPETSCAGSDPTGISFRPKQRFPPTQTVAGSDPTNLPRDPTSLPSDPTPLRSDPTTRSHTFPIPLSMTSMTHTAQNTPLFRHSTPKRGLTVCGNGYEQEEIHPPFTAQ